MEHTLENNLPESGRRFRDSNLAQAWLVLALAILFGAALAAVQVQLSAKIAQNKMNETLEKIPEIIWGADAARKMAAQDPAVEIIPGSLEIKTGAKTETYNLFKVSRENRLAGWVIRAGGQGYADKIELLVGVDPAIKTVTGLFILDQKETPGLGNKITHSGWRRQFIGKATDQPLAVIKSGEGDGHTIDAVTGATISSRSVTRIVNRVLADMQGRLTPETVVLSERQS